MLSFPARGRFARKRHGCYPIRAEGRPGRTPCRSCSRDCWGRRVPPERSSILRGLPHRSQRTLTLLIVAPLVVLAAVPPSAVAEARVPAVSAGQHCIVEVVSVRSGQRAPSRAVERCYRTFSAAMHHASGGRVRLPATAEPATVSSRAVDTPTTRSIPDGSSLPIGTAWVGAGYSGVSYTIHTAHPGACLGGYTFGANYPPRWRDAFSSARAWRGCRYITLRTGLIGATGSLTRTCGPNCWSCNALGPLDDRASSWRIHGGRS